MKFSISFKYSNVTFKNKETKETISYDTKADGNTFTFDNVDEDIVLGIVKGIKDRKASQVFSHDDFRTNFINTMARNKCKELYDKLDKGEWKIGDISISNITIKDLEFTKPTMNARETLTVESKKRITESYWLADYKWNQPYEVVFTDGSSFTVPGKTEDPINFYRHYNNKSYEDIMRKTYGNGLELGKKIDHFIMQNGNVITNDDIQDELDFYYDELKAKLSFQETSDLGLNESKEEVEVEFKKTPDDGTVIAFFPQTMHDGSCNPGNIMSYEHNGQHGEASIDFYNDCTNCFEEDYASLLHELEGIYDDCELVVVQK